MSGHRGKISRAVLFRLKLPRSTSEHSDLFQYPAIDKGFDAASESPSPDDSIKTIAFRQLEFPHTAAAHALSNLRGAHPKPDKVFHQAGARASSNNNQA